MALVVAMAAVSRSKVWRCHWIHAISSTSCSNVFYFSTWHILACLYLFFFYNVFTPAASSSAKVCTPQVKNGQSDNSQSWPRTLTYRNSLCSTTSLTFHACPLHVTLRNACAGSCKHSLCCVSVFTSSERIPTETVLGMEINTRRLIHLTALNLQLNLSEFMTVWAFWDANFISHIHGNSLLA